MWLKFDQKTKKASCKVCNGQILSAKAGRKDLVDHQKSKKHIKNVKAIGLSDIAVQMYDNPVQKERDKTIKTEIGIVMAGVAHNLSFEQISGFVDKLTGIVSDNSALKNVKLGKTKTRNIVANVIGPIQHKYVVNLMKTKKWSLLVDESTDKGKVKALACIVRVKDGEFIKDYFYELIPVKDGTARGLYNSVLEQFERDGIPYKTNMVGYGSDGANVVAGCNESLGALLRKDVPHLFYIKCVCHSFALLKLVTCCLHLLKPSSNMCSVTSEITLKSSKNLMNFRNF